MTVTPDLTPASPAQFSARPYRHKMRSLAYVNLGSSNGILRDLGQSGLAMQTAKPLPVGEELELRLDLANPRCRVDAVGRVVWADSTAQAGVEFTSLTARSQRALSEWLLAQLLSDAVRITGDGELLFSSAARPAIRIEQETLASFLPASDDDSPRLRMLGFAVSIARFARVVDGLVLLCSVLLFSLISLFLIDILPVWPFTVAFLLGVTAIFAGLYWFVFALWFGATPGCRLAMLAASVGEGGDLQPVQGARFR